MAAATIEHQNPAQRIRDLARNAVALGLLWYFYAAVREMSVAGVGDAFENSHSVRDLQRSVGLDLEAQIQSVLAFSWLFKAANWYYLVHFPVTLVALIASYWWVRDNEFVRLRNSLIGATTVALIVHVQYPLAPPRMLAGYLDTAAVFGPNPYALPGSSSANQFAAMPSMHAAWALLVAFVLWSVSDRFWVWALGLFHVLATSAVVIVTANHYLLDIVIGWFLAGITWYLASRMQGQLSLERLGISQRRPQQT